MLLFAVLMVWLSHAASETIRTGEIIELSGTKDFYELPGTEITLYGYLKFCKPVYCPTCIRVPYLNVGESLETSVCLEARNPSKMWNCWKYKFSKKIKTPKKPGNYKIWAYSLLEYKCGTVPDNAQGIVLGTVNVGNPLYWLEGKTSFSVPQGGTISVRGCYKYCKQDIYCPRCIRQLYFHAGGAGSSACAAHINAGPDLDCKKHCVTRDVKVPNAPGKYNVRAYELLEYKCRANDFTGGARVGTVDVTGEKIQEAGDLSSFMLFSNFS
ncbi:hypothetical protein OS493_010790 [Desmophyllum pertusum]|uniref:Uncharacterized protein n=1 Tax=Desmophyllum pertusum TaxID=174260 RepID=A0A9X0CXZ2_9CNID|nr:hypothetical protein OS493_010790 [Desmophyllum pertusum]